MTPTEEACIRPVLERIGIPTERRDGSGEAWFGWNGRALNLAVKPSDAIHETAHWLLAKSARRALEDFGLESVKIGRADSEESLASALGILIERHLGMNWQETFAFHSWDRNGGIRDFHLKVRILRNLGLVRGLTPVCFLEGR